VLMARSETSQNDNMDYLLHFIKKDVSLIKTLIGAKRDIHRG
jgi:hypothetical protein